MAKSNMLPHHLPLSFLAILLLWNIVICTSIAIGTTFFTMIAKSKRNASAALNAGIGI